MTVAEIVGIYGAIIATILAIKEIYLILTNLRVSYSFSYKYASDGFGNQIGLGEFVLVLEIVNRGKTKRIISSLKLKLPKKTYDFDLISIVSPDEYPITLNEGEIFRKEVNLSQLLNVIKDCRVNDSDNIKFYFQDTLGKKYFTKGIKIKTIKEFTVTKINGN